MNFLESNKNPQASPGSCLTIQHIEWLALWYNGEDSEGERKKDIDHNQEREREREAVYNRGFIGPGWACNGTGSQSIEMLLRPFVGVMTLGFSIIKILSLCWLQGQPIINPMLNMPLF